MTDPIASKAKPFTAGRLAGSVHAEALRAETAPPESAPSGPIAADGGLADVAGIAGSIHAQKGRGETAARDGGTVAPMASGLGLIDLADLGGTIRGFTMFGTAGLGVFDQAGFSVATVGDVDGDGFDDIVVGEGGGYLGGGGYYNVAGMAYVINGKGSGHADIELEDIDAGGAADGGSYVYGGSQYAGVGYAVSGIGDINGDGFQDFALGAPRAQTPFTTYTDDGKAYIVFGDGSLPDIDIAAMAATDGFTVNGLYGAGDELGWTATGGGDLNGDGFDDVVISSTYGLESGETFVIFGGAGPFADVDRSGGTPDAAWTFTGAVTSSVNDTRGTMAATGGDIDGDGFDDLILGYRSFDAPAKPGAGKVEVWLGGAGAPVSGGVLTGAATGDNAGRRVANAGDVNGDGYDDIAISAPSIVNGANGMAYVVFGKPGGVGTVDLSALVDGFAILGDDAFDHIATDIKAAGDVNGDGFDDVILSTWYADTGAGEAYVIFGKAGATNSFADVDLGALTIADGFRIIPEGAGDGLGGAVSSAGDLDGDGYDDLLIGAQSAEDVTGGGGTAGAGRAYVIFGSDTIAGATSTVTHQGTSAGETLTGTVLGADVMIGGQGADLIVGLGGADVLRGGEGDDLLRVGDNTFRRIDGGTGTNVMQVTGNFSGGITLTDADFLRVNDVSSIDLFDGSFNVTVGAIASNALIGRTLQIGTTGGNMTGLVDGRLLDEGMNANFLAALGPVTLLGGLADDTMQGGNGIDYLIGGAGGDDLVGGGGRDRAMYATDASGVVADLLGTNAGTNDALGDSFSGIEDLSGSLFDDSLYGDDDAGGNRLIGLMGNDTLEGRDGADTLLGGAGNDNLVGGLGTDTASYADATSAVLVQLDVAGPQNTGGGGVDDLSSIENLIGGSGNDTVFGTGNANDLAGGLGNDILLADAGADTLRGGGGDDTLSGGGDADVLVGGGGADIAFYAGEVTAVDFDLKTMTSTIGAVVDQLNGIEGAIGGLAGDRLSGDKGDNEFHGGGGADKLIGRRGADTLTGGEGADRLIGGDGADQYLFIAGFDNGDVIVGFDGNGAAAGDEILIDGYAGPVTFTDIGGGQWEISDGVTTDVITFVALFEPIDGDDWGVVV